MRNLKLYNSYRTNQIAEMSHLRPIVAGAAVTLYLGVAYGAFKVQKVRNRPEPPAEIAEPCFQRTLTPQGHEAYSSIASRYDNEVGWDEWIMGMSNRRRELVGRVSVRTIILFLTMFPMDIS